MSTINTEDIIGYGVGKDAKENVCIFCVTAEERNKSNELNYILESELQRWKKTVFCDRCREELIFTEIGEVPPY